MTSPAARRLPGFRFESQPPPLDESLPRLDVSAFVGFAASGPLQTPVVVEDPSQFAAIFGADAPLAWDPDAGSVVRAQLAPTVRAFFRNGGRRAWVVRVAGPDAVVNRFPVPGLARVGSDGTITPAFARARSAGSWSDALEVTAALASATVEVAALALDAGTVDIRMGGTAAVSEGDLLRFTFNGGADVLTATVAAWTAPKGGGALPPTVSRFTLSQSQWFRASWNAGDVPASGTVVGYHHDEHDDVIEGPSVPATAPLDPTGQPAWAASVSMPVTLTLDQSLAEAPAPGSLVRARFGAESFWLRVESVRATSGGSPSGEAVEVTGAGLWESDRGPIPRPTSLPTAERLSFELWVRQAGGDPVKLVGLAFAPGHPSFWAALPEDEALFRDLDLSQAAAESSASAYLDLWQTAAQPRFPLSGAGGGGRCWFVPIDMAVVPDAYLGPEATTDDPLTRDGLAQFDASLFLDPRPTTPLSPLIEADTLSLPAEADYLRYDAPDPPPFTGIYTLMDLDEATVVAVPDAAQRPWTRVSADASAPPPSATVSPTSAAMAGAFEDCGRLTIPTPVLAVPSPDPTGSYVLEWTVPSATPAGAVYRLEESTDPGFAGAVTLAVGPSERFPVYGRPPGDYYYRVRVETTTAGDWSLGVAARAGPSVAWQVVPASDYNPDGLLAVQRALLRVCAARGDLFAVLSAPAHDREDDVIEHASALRTPAGAAIDVNGAQVAPIGAAEARALSFGALYHPWVLGTDASAADDPRLGPPDGYVCGTFALRATTRGPWVAPANQPWTGPVDLEPAIARERRVDLQTAQVNLARQEPHGFVTLSADTLSLDDDLRPVGVRRLLSLLRRLALRLGASYVFEPSNASFRRMVRRGFESMLETMYLRGAFAGATREASFQVAVTTSSADVEAGRFIVEIKVAPSLPMTFLTIRLIQTGDRGLVAEGT